MGKQDQDQGFTGQRLPGTGGDFIDTTDVEGHRHIRNADDTSTDPPARDADDTTRRYPDVEGDVEGHRAPAGEGEKLYRNLPTTQGEVIMRGPGDNPHGDR